MKSYPHLIQTKAKRYTVYQEPTQILSQSNEVIHIILYEPISKRPPSKSFDEPHLESVRTDVIGTFWGATWREFYHIA